MKRMLTLSVSLALLLCGCAANGRGEAPPEPPTFSPTPPVTVAATSVPMISSAPTGEPVSCWTKLDAAAPMQVDLDGDGADETVAVRVDEDAFVSDVTVEYKNGTLTDHLDTALMFMKAYYGDAKREDGSGELYITGDTASDDYTTFAYRIRDGKLQRAEFYGEVMDCDGTAVTVRSYANVLGTYDCTYTNCLSDEGFSFTRTSSYRITRYEGDWDERKLTLQRDGLPVQTGTGKTTLQKGAELMLVETDQESYAVLCDRQKQVYRLDMERQEEDWRWFIDGVAEEDWFGMLMYAG